MSEVLKSHYELIKELLSETRFLIPILVIWTASFGSSLHGPINSYYYREIGASDTDIGLFLSIGSTMSLFVNPFYGWMLDKHGPYIPMLLACFVCALGCLVRGTASGTSQLFMSVCCSVRSHSLSIFLSF